MGKTAFALNIIQNAAIRSNVPTAVFSLEMSREQLVNRMLCSEAMLDAQKHPENHKQLVVRVWGWSAYFVELDKEYQDHVIARQAYRV